jgi:hypothetical protein
MRNLLKTLSLSFDKYSRTEDACAVVPILRSPGKVSAGRERTMSDLIITPEVLDAFESSLGRKTIHCLSNVQVQALVKTIRNAWTERDSLRGELHALRTFVAQKEATPKE